MKVAMFSSKPYEEQYFRQANPDVHQFSYLQPHLDEDTAILASGHDAVCCFVNDTASATVLQMLAGMGVKLLALRCAGFNNVDLAAARDCGITVCRVPEYSPFAVAEHTVALILSLNRHIHRAHNRVRENDYSLNGLLGFDLHGKTVGVIGAGRIGKVFIRIMLGFGCRVLVHDPVATNFPDGSEATDLETLLQSSDIISLHCPLTPDTHHLINADSIARTRRGFMLINTSRGGLVDTKAVIHALKTGHIGYLGLDVYEEEADLFFEDLSNELVQDDVFARLLTFPNVIITGHQAFFTHEALSSIARVTLANIDAYDAGRTNDLHKVE
jgi:D-lactate dehydrogenase